MIIPLECEIYRLCAGDERPMLAYVKVERTTPTAGIMLALNGWAAVAIPVILTEDESVGLIHRSTLERAYKEHRALSKRHSKREQVALVIEGAEQELVHLPAIGMRLGRWNEENDKAGTFPDIWPLIPAWPEKIMRTERHQSTFNQFSLNPHVYYECSRAIGLSCSMSNADRNTPTFYQVTRSSPFIGAAGGWTETGRPIAPWICMMPVHGLYLDDPYYADKLAAHLAGRTYSGPG